MAALRACGLLVLEEISALLFNGPIAQFRQTRGSNEVVDRVRAKAKTGSGNGATRVRIGVTFGVSARAWSGGCARTRHRTAGRRTTIRRATA
jgi:hypothetical protein